MKVSIKTEMVFWLAALCVLSTVTHSNGACNMAVGLKNVSFVFLKSDDSSYATKYGYDTDISGGSHVSVALGETTFVTVMYDKKSDLVYEALTASDFDDYGYKLKFDSGVTALLRRNVSFHAEDGRPLAIQGNQTGSFTVKIEPKTADDGTGVCGELKVHVYNKKTEAKLHMYVESGVSKSYTGFESTINPVIKPAVMELTAVEVHSNYDFQYDSTSYGGNGNGSFDSYRDGGGDGPEKSALTTRLNSIKNTPKVCIMNKTAHALRLTRGAAAGQPIVFVNDPSRLLRPGRNDVYVGGQGPMWVDEYVKQTDGSYKVVFRSNLTSAHSTGYSDGVFLPGAVAFPNSAAVSCANLGNQFVVHEVLHLKEFGALSDISPSASGVGDNVMKSTNMGFGELRYRTLSGEIQWDKVHQ